ncbi:amidohydrolase family protein [Candidatus Pelagibacter bacterium nBUS_28]|jgi:hypothetical protein|uniref:amidohydrolase family protein n=1 Tax=Candidatus Pelagibacter bacterium nBUS_28 TaxID=3374189 RepID=UPI003EBE0771
MNIFDSNIHLPCTSKVDLSEYTFMHESAKSLKDMLHEDLNMTYNNLLNCFSKHLDTIKNNSNGCNIMIFNSKITPDELKLFVSNVRKKINNSYFTMLINPKDNISMDKLSEFKDAGLTAIKFHGYIQKISKEKFQSVVNISVNAEILKMPILVDSSYGGLNMYKYKSIELISCILEKVTKVPVVILHSGGAKAIEALLLADACKNVYLDTSFSVPYYLGSSIEKDLAFAYKKIGTQRVLYGSDFPYVDIVDSFEKTSKFLELNKFLEKDCERILSKTSMDIFFK